MIERALRAGALLFAVLAFLDPALSRATGTRQTVVVLPGPDDADPLGLAARVVRAVEGSFHVSRKDVPDPAAYVLTDADLPDGFRPPPEAVLFAVAPEVSSTDLRIVRVSAPKALTVDSVAHVDVEAFAGGSGDRDVTVSLVVDGAPVQEATSRIAGQDSRVAASLTFVPSQPGVVHLRVRASAPGRRTAVADAAVTVTSRVWRILSFDRRPTYSSTFVRRTLERDPRFEVTTRIVTSRDSAIETSGPPASLGSAGALDEFDAVIIGAAEALGASEAAALTRYLRDRHGAVVLLPEGPGGAALPALTGQDAWREVRRAEPVAVTAAAGAWTAREFVWPAEWPPLTQPLATVALQEGDAVPRYPVWQAPVGSGRLVVSTTVDGWRSRTGESLGYSAFWRAVTASIADATPPPVRVDIGRRLLQPGEEIGIEVELFADGDPEARLRDTSGLSSQVRLWPSGEAASGGTRRWTGGVRAPDMPGRYRFEVTTGSGASGVAEFLVTDPEAFDHAPLRDASGHNGLSGAAARAHRGAVVAAADIDTLPGRIAAAADPVMSQQPWHPMRSVWWLVPFTLCASGEWWLRRRRGQR